MAEPESMEILSFIDVDAWNEARWRGTLFAVDPTGEASPAIGILYRDEATGRKIFTDLVARLGRQDSNELLRVSIIEGDIPGEAPGYSVYIGTDFNNYSAFLKSQGQDISKRLVGLVGRFHRMNPTPGSPFLPAFKQHYAKLRTYRLMPAFGDPASPVPVWDLSIEKKHIQFLRAENLGKNDVERVVLKDSCFDE